jgi:hypothetical protein
MTILRGQLDNRLKNRADMAKPLWRHSYCQGSSLAPHGTLNSP